MTRTLPAQKRFQTDHASALSFYLGLVMDDELSVLDCFMHRCLQAEVRQQFDVHIWDKGAVSIAPTLLGAIHRRIAEFHQRFRICRVIGIRRDADARCHRYLAGYPRVNGARNAS